jgi:hypothetical protein
VVIATWIASSIAPVTPLNADSPQTMAQRVTVPVKAGMESDLPPESELVYLPTKSPNPVPPNGWRRTELGWENVSTWPKPGRPLGAIVNEQELREPRWFNHVLSQVRQLPPLTFAALQVATIAIVVRLSRRRR